MTIHQGSLYVTDSNPPQGVQRFDATTGVNAGNFVPTLPNPSPRDVKVNPANNRLYVLYYNGATVETFDLTTLASFGLLMPAGSPIALTVSPFFGHGVWPRRQPVYLWRHVRGADNAKSLLDSIGVAHV